MTGIVSLFFGEVIVFADFFLEEDGIRAIADAIFSDNSLTALRILGSLIGKSALERQSYRCRVEIAVATESSRSKSDRSRTGAVTK